MHVLVSAVCNYLTFPQTENSSTTSSFFNMFKFPPLMVMAVLLVSTAHAVQSCSSFSINGSYPATFNFYRFYDFQYVNNSDTTPYISIWPKDRAFNTSLVQRQNFSDKAWTDEWSIRVAYKQAANDKLDALHYVPDNIYMGALLSLFWHLRH